MLFLFPEKHELRAFSIEHWRRSGRDPTCVSLDNFTCAFRLPPVIHHAFIHGPGSFITSCPPESFPDSKPPFVPDPSLDILAIQLAISIEPGAPVPHTRNFVLLTHVSSLLPHIDFALAANSGTISPTIIPWVDWGPQSTRIIGLSPRTPPHWVSAQGSRCLLVFPRLAEDRTTPGEHFDMFVLDAHPFAELPSILCPPDPQAEDLLCKLYGVLCDDYVGRDSLQFMLREDVKATLPFRVVHHTVSLEPHLWPLQCCLTEDGVGMVVVSENDQLPGGFYMFSV